MKRFSEYNISIMILIITGSLLVSAFNRIVDPFNIFAAVDIKGFNHEKTNFGKLGVRGAKSVALLRGDYQTVIMGSSRVLNGLDPQHPCLQPGKTYNLALPAVNMYETYRIFNYAKNNLKLHTVILGLDFLSFSTIRTVDRDYELSLFSGKSIWYLALQYTFSYKNTEIAIQTVRDNINGKKAQYRPDGFRNRKIDFDKKSFVQRDLFTQVLSQNFFILEDTYAGYVYSADRLDLFAKLLNEAREDGIKLYLLITPIHARQLEAIRVTGLFPTFEQWKRDLVHIIEDHNASHPEEEPVILWDFALYNDITTEDVPRADQKGVFMKWFSDSSHISREAGNMVLDIMLKCGETSNKPPDNFGVKINVDNIEKHLAKIRLGQKKYHESHPYEVKEVEELARATKRFRPKRDLVDKPEF